MLTNDDVQKWGTISLPSTSCMNESHVDVAANENENIEKRCSVNYTSEHSFLI